MFVPNYFENVPPGLIRTYNLLLKVEVAKSEKIVGCSSYLQTIERNSCQLSILNKFADQDFQKKRHMYITTYVLHTIICVFWGFANYKYMLFSQQTQFYKDISYCKVTSCTTFSFADLPPNLRCGFNIFSFLSEFDRKCKWFFRRGQKILNDATIQWYGI